MIADWANHMFVAIKTASKQSKSDNQRFLILTSAGVPPR